MSTHTSPHGSTQDTAVAFGTPSRIHIGLEVEDLARSVAFYRVLLGAEPGKQRTGYARFEPEHPPLNLSLAQMARHELGAPGVAHFGVQVKSIGEVTAMVQRLRDAGLPVRLERHVTCCYAVQDKLWTRDPDGNPWEVFVVLDDDAEVRDDPEGCCEADASSCCPAATPGDGSR